PAHHAPMRLAPCASFSRYRRRVSATSRLPIKEVWKIKRGRGSKQFRWNRIQHWKIRCRDWRARVLLRRAAHPSPGPLPGDCRAQPPGYPYRTGQPVLMEAVAQMGARVPGAAAPLQGANPRLGGNGAMVEHRMIEIHGIERQRR